VYSGHVNGSAAILRVAADGSSTVPELLLNLPGWDVYPTLSPDGQTLVFTTDWRAYDFLGDLYAITVGDPGSMRPVWLGSFPGISFLFAEARWAPVGDRIAFAECRFTWAWCDAEGMLSIVGPDGDGYRILTPTFGFASPSWSPTGSHIAYTMWDCLGQAPCIRIIAADGGPWIEVLDNAHQPAWRP
jgi:Tol biopolymer transport system component